MLLSNEYAARQAHSFRAGYRQPPAPPCRNPLRRTNPRAPTPRIFSVIDAAGNRVAGHAQHQPAVRLCLHRTRLPAVLLNNEMDDFLQPAGTAQRLRTYRRRGANAIAPGKRPLSSMSPDLH